MSGNQSAPRYNANTNTNGNGNGSGASGNNNTNNSSNYNQYSAMGRWLAEGKKDEPWTPVNTSKGSGSRRAADGNGSGGSSSRR